MEFRDQPGELARFVPAFVRNRLVAGPLTTAADESFHEPGWVAVLFADISGFTALSEKLAARGSEGVEELTEVLNAYFGRIIEIITAHGGDVVKFAGDAMLAYWPADGEAGLGAAAERAAVCGLEAQEALKTFGTTINHRLRMRIGVGAGPVAIVSLGGVFNRWECVMIGPSVIEATVAAAKAEPGFVTMGAVAWDAIKDRARGWEIEPGHTVVEGVRPRSAPGPIAAAEVPAGLEPRLLRFIPAAIHRRLAARQGGWLAELRRLTVIFINLPDLNASMDVEASRAVVRDLQAELYRFEGSVNKLSIDEKGVTLVAALGLPPLAHEDDPHRGVLAAMAMGERLAALGWHYAIGVTSGTVFCGTIGNATRCEYTIIGDVVNLSARLMMASKGGVLCDEATARLTRDRMAWEELPAIMVKGKSRPIPVFRPADRGRGAASSRGVGAIVGRAAERAMLGEMLAAVKIARTGSIAVIEGEAGIGKSALLGYLIEEAKLHAIATWVGGASPMERSTPFFAWRSIFRQLFGLEGGASVEDHRQTLLGALMIEPALWDLAPLLDVVLCLDLPASTTTAAMFGEVRLHNTNALLVRLLKARADAGPLHVVLEDGHWMDSASWSLAAEVGRRVPSLMMTILTRPIAEPAPRDLAAIVALPGARKITLGALAIDEELALVKRRLGVEEIPPALADFLRSKAQGNPFFLEEIAFALRDSGKLVIDGGRCAIAAGVDLDALPFPDHVQGVVTSRIDRLGASEQLTLKVASVVGRVFSCAILRDICPIEDDKPHLGDYLDALVAQHLTSPETPEPDPSFRFRHAITQEVAYQMMPPTQRRALHRSVAEWYESRYEADLSPFFPLLAKHWCATDQAGRAIDYLEKSGENAMRDFAHEEAVAFFAQALALDDRTSEKVEPSRRVRWTRQLAEAHYALGDHVRSREQFHTTLRLLGHEPKASTWRSVASFLREFVRQGLHRAFPRAFVGVASGDAADRRLEASRAYERLTQIYYLNNEKLPSIEATFRSLNLSESVGPSPELARHYAHAAVISGLLMMHRTARSHATRARQVARQVEQDECSAYVQFICAVYSVTVGDWESCRDDLTEAIATADRIGQRRRGDECRFTLANALSRMGDFAGAARISEELQESQAIRPVPQILAWSMSWRLDCLRTIDPADPAIPGLEESILRLLADNPEMPMGDQILGHGVVARSRFHRGDPAGATASAAAAQAVIDRTDQISHYLLPAYAGLVEVAIAAGDRPRASALLKILGQFRMMYPVGRPAFWLLKAGYHRMTGRSRKVVPALRRSLAAAEACRMPFERDEARAALAAAQAESR